MKAKFVSLILLVALANTGYGQLKFSKIFKKSETDSIYYDELKNMLTTRVFMATKFSDFMINDDKLDQNLQYKSNQTQGVGIGASYKGLTLNIGYGVSTSNQNDSLFGQTQRIDLQTHFYTRRFAIDIYSAIYRGFYLENSKDAIKNWPKGKYYTRPNMKSSTYGISSSYFFNHKRFSNRATFAQNEWQKKSAGSFIMGASVIFNKIEADSSFIPTNIIDSNFFKGNNYVESDYFNFGTHIGYTYILVFKEKLFANLGLNVGLLLGKNTILNIEGEEKSKQGLDVNLMPTIAFGYNSRRFYAGFSYSSVTSVAPTPIKETSQAITNGMYKFVLAYRFKLHDDFRILPKKWGINF